MKNKIQFQLVFLLILVLILFSKIIFTRNVYAQESREDMLVVLVEALNYETDNFYNSYADFINLIENSNDDFSNKFNENIHLWETVCQEADKKYAKYLNTGFSDVNEIANLAHSGSVKAIEALNTYKKSYNSETEEEFNKYLDLGDELFFEAENIHFQSVDKYNNYSGVNEVYLYRNLLILGSIVFSSFSLFLFFKSKVKSKLFAERLRSEVFKNFFKSSLWMTIGILITTIGYSYALKEGGTYYILYGPILVGGYQLLKGFGSYYSDGRVKLNQLSQNERNAIIKDSFKDDSFKDLKKKKNCLHCGTQLLDKAIVCSKCGENIL